MKPLYKGLAVALVHLLIVLSLGGKLLYDRATSPRVWVRTGSYDPDLPIRGRYFTMSPEVRLAGPLDGKPFPPGTATDFSYVELAVENGELVAHRTLRHTGMSVGAWSVNPDHGGSYSLSPPVIFFIPEHAETPRIGRGAELWAEVTIPKNGPPRPIQLAIKRGNEWTPLTYR